MDLNKNRVGLGTFPLASVFNKISPKEAKEIIRLFIDRGGYYIDTAPLYGFGEVENLLGEVLQDYDREQFYIATKCIYVDVEDKDFTTVQKSGKYDDVLRECDRSLERLKLDYVDLYFSHSVDPDTPIGETREALEELQLKGKIKEIGVSNVNLEELKEYNKNGKVKFVQNRFSLINRSIEGDLQKYMLENDIKLVPYQVLDRGQLTGKVFENIGNLREGDLRKGKGDWEEEKLKVVGDWVKENLSPIAEETGCTLGQLSMAWALHQPHMGFLIVGVTNPEFVEINLKADEVDLNDDTLREIDSAYSKLEKQIREKYGQSVREFRGLNEKYY